MSATRRDVLKQGLALGAVGLALLREDALERLAAAQSRAGERTAEALAGDEDFWFHVREAYAVDRSVINLNNGGVSPSPRTVMDALRRHMEFANNIPSRNLWTIQDPQQELVRQRLARAFGCEPDEMAITRNASESLETCILGLDLKAGDEALTTDQDYPRMLTTWEQRQRREGIVLRKVRVPTPASGAAELLELFASNVTDRTRVILCSHVVNITGQIFPVRSIVEMARARGIAVIVDGAHAFAHLDFRRDELGCDYYGTSLHKWLSGPLGSGFLYVRSDRIESLWPLMAAPEALSKDVRKFEEIGTHSAAHRLAIAEALTLHELIGPRRKQERMRLLRDRWARRLGQDPRVRFSVKLDAENSCGVTTFAIEGIEPARLHAYLWDKHRIWTTAIDHADVKGLRITPHVYTTLEEIDIFCEAVEAVLARGLPAATGGNVGK